MKVVKNKVAPPFETAQLKIVFGKGSDYDEELVDVAKDMGIINKTSSWLSYKEIKGQGSGKFAELLKEAGLYEEVKNLVING